MVTPEENERRKGMAAGASSAQDSAAKAGNTAAAATVPKDNPIYADPSKPWNWNPQNATYPGIQPGVQQTQMAGLDFTQPGAAEAYWNQVMGQFAQPTQASQRWEQNSGQLAEPGAGSQWWNQNQDFYNTQGFGQTTLQNLSSSLGGPSSTQDYWSQMAGQLRNPGMGETFAGSQLDKYSQGTPGVTNFSTDAYQQFLQNRPEVSQDANLGKYYDEAERRGANKLNTQLAARGAYGSSVGVGELGNLFTGLEAEKANREADYYLRALGEQRAWEGLGGDMAQGADMGSLRQSQNELGWMSGLGNLATTAQQEGMQRWLAGLSGSQAADATGLARAGMAGDMANQSEQLGLQRTQQGGQMAMNAGQEDLSRLLAGLQGAQGVDAGTLAQLLGGMQGANIAQGAQRQRGQDYFTNELMMGDRLSGIMGSGYGEMLGMDQEAFDTALAEMLGIGAEDLNQSQNNDAAAQAAANAKRQQQMQYLQLALMAMVLL